MKPKYTLNDLTVRHHQTTEKDNMAYTHKVLFNRPLSLREQQQFTRLLISFYDVVHFSQRFGNGFLAEPSITFMTQNQASYTFYRENMGGDWKELLFAMLATFSTEVVGIAQHDGNPVFDPTRIPKNSPSENALDLSRLTKIN
ncbi:MAG: hypothetical protein DRR00_33725 [Candidatus Parabeggiatoa sp. nov. 3]|nr:MAG: hypothetical protein DRR00_33725 [Gammaproteobacteria bacterium]RKZ51420.1 MAG: hypothetical protein DRQ99_33205 [Gammaproteobacteria bacterium]HEW98326.1 hypothetical protein [Beggiatoa sp.]